MPNLYTLSVPMEDDMRSVLNERRFHIKKTPDDRLVFKDPISGAILLTTSSVVGDSGESETGFREFITSSGTKYSVMKLTESIVAETSDGIPVPSKRDKVTRQINYGDGYDGFVAYFDTPISYEQFISYCKSENLDLNKMDKYSWYEDHAHVSASPIKSGNRWNTNDQPAAKPGQMSSVWTYLWVRAYTD